MSLSAEERKIVLSLAEVVTPAGGVLGAPGEEMLAALEGLLSVFGPGAAKGYGEALRVLDWVSVPACGGRRFSNCDLSTRQGALRVLGGVSASAWALRIASAPIKAARSKDATLRAALGIRPEDEMLRGGAPEPARWRAQMQDARDLPPGEVLEVDVVVIGSGAGGGAVAHRLASQGMAVLILEEGGYFGRADFGSDPIQAQQKMFRKGGALFALGNTAIPVLMGVTVGGSTTINSGTCYRVPAQTQRRWMLDEGLHMLGPGSLDPYYERVEAMLQVEQAQQAVLGGCARVIARGAEALGLEHGPLMRNAPGCDGHGLCVFGCPTGAKRSADVSYLPAALSKGAMLIHHARAVGILMESDRAAGVSCEVVGTSARFEVRAKSVVMAGGTLPTPALLLRERLANRSGRVGHGLTLHPASQTSALFDEEIRGWEGIPQGYAVESFAHEGLRFEGAFLPLEVSASAVPQWGDAWTAIVEQFDHLACFGFMVADSGQGRVVLGPKGEPKMLYWMRDHDRRRLIAGQALLSRLYFAAGAREVFPAVQGPWSTLRHMDDAMRFAADAPRTLKPWHLDVSAYHPLGTCRMGVNPLTSVLGPTHETHDIKHLFICDGSAVPGPLGVNPQMTIMAFAERAAAFIEQRVEQHRSPAQREEKTRKSVEFFEGMAGDGELFFPPSPTTVRFEVRATWPIDWSTAWANKRFDLKLSGRIHIPGLTHPDTPCTGSLQINLLQGDGALVYDLDFNALDDSPAHLHGAKHVGITKPFMGMTTLHTALTRASDNTPLGRATVLFDPSELFTWFGTWRVTERPGN